MLPARGPFCEGSSSKLTRWPSLSCSKSPASTELRWKNHSWPPSSLMNPKPRSLTRRLIVPFATSITSAGRMAPQKSDQVPFPPWTLAAASVRVGSRSGEPASPTGYRLQGAGRRLERQYLVRNGARKRAIGREHERGEPTGTDNPREIRCENRSLIRAERCIGMFGQQDARGERERPPEPEPQFHRGGQ